MYLKNKKWIRVRERTNTMGLGGKKGGGGATDNYCK